jgi:hypothetical protein
MKKLWVKVYRIRTHDPHFVRKCVRDFMALDPIAALREWKHKVKVWESTDRSSMVTFTV